MTLNIATLTLIRRKVDKATKRADEQHFESTTAAPKNQHRYALGVVTIPATALAKLPDDNMGCDLSQFIVKGDYSPIYPASIGATVAELRLPHTIARDADEARYVARPLYDATATA